MANDYLYIQFGQNEAGDDSPKGPDHPGQFTDSRQPNQYINGQENIKEALGLIKDWVTAVVAIQTAAIGAIGVFDLKAGRTTGPLPLLQLVPVCASLFFFFWSVFFGMSALHMLPGLAQRKPVKPENDVYLLKTVGNHELNFWARGFWWFFLAGLFSFAFFAAAHTFGT